MLKKPCLYRLSVMVAVLLGVASAQAQQQEMALNQLKSEAFKALKGGQFDKTSQLLGQAVALSNNDPSLLQMTDWVNQFIQQREQYLGDRKKAFDKSVDEVKKLMAAGFEEAAIDHAKDAYLLSTDKTAFAKEAWVVDLMAAGKRIGQEADEKNLWFQAQRVYADLGSLDPTNPLWRERFKSATGRLRLLAMYTPDDFRKAVEEEAKRREQAELAINPATQPTSRPAPEENDSFKYDWHDMLRGVKMDMLLDALDDARTSYWRDVSYKTLTNGGLKSLRALITTRGLDKAFPTIADEAKRQSFATAIDRGTEMMDKAAPADEGRLMRRVLDNVLMANRDSINVPDEVIANEFADGAFGELDPFSTMIWPSDWDEFNKSTQGEFTGVGIQIQLDDDGNLKVVTPLEDSPAYRAGIQANDLIVKINGKNARNISINQAVKNITGPEGSMVTLTIKSTGGAMKDYPIRREKIHVASVKGYMREPGGAWDYYVDPQQKIGYMRMTNFTRTTEEELGQALDDLKKTGAKAIILDLRNNPGGLLATATEVCDRFLSKGVIVSTKGERELPDQPPIEAKASPDDVTLPMVVLVNQLSASASEIVSGALQDYKRAMVVGERTFGKGSVQMLFPLASRTAALKLTTSHYYLPSGRCIHKEDGATVWGVDPDLMVEMSGEQMRAAQDARMQMEVLRDGKGDAAPKTGPATSPNVLTADPQLSAAVLMLKLELAGATL